MSTSTAVSGVSGEVKGVEAQKEAAVAVTEAKKEATVAVAVAAVAVEDDGEGEEGDCDCEECQGGIVDRLSPDSRTAVSAEYEEEGGWIDELGVDEHDFY
jgi:hypothetical protein